MNGLAVLHLDKILDLSILSTAHLFQHLLKFRSSRPPFSSFNSDASELNLPEYTVTNKMLQSSISEASAGITV